MTVTGTAITMTVTATATVGNGNGNISGYTGNGYNSGVGGKRIDNRNANGSGNIGGCILSHPYTTAACAAGVVTGTAGRDSSGCRYHEN